MTAADEAAVTRIVDEAPPLSSAQLDAIGAVMSVRLTDPSQHNGAAEATPSAVRSERTRSSYLVMPGV